MSGFSLERPADPAGTVVLRIDTGKANAMTAESLAGLRRALEQAREQSPRALVITGAGRSFSAGLALPGLVDLGRDELREFMVGFAAAMEDALTFPVPTVAAINGHAIAGGCVLALMCDIRVMATGRARIGLNEVAIGIGLPAIVIEPLRARIPAASFPGIGMAGDLVTPDEALARGIVDEVVSPEQLEERALAVADSLSAAPWAAQQVKRAWLRPVLERIRQHEDAELESWLDTWFSPGGRRAIAAAVATLT